MFVANPPSSKCQCKCDFRECYQQLQSANEGDGTIIHISFLVQERKFTGCRNSPSAFTPRASVDELHRQLIKQFPFTAAECLEQWNLPGLRRADQFHLLLLIARTQKLLIGRAAPHHSKLELSLPLQITSVRYII